MDINNSYFKIAGKALIFLNHTLKRHHYQSVDGRQYSTYKMFEIYERNIIYQKQLTDNVVIHTLNSFFDNRAAFLNWGFMSDHH